MKSSYLVLLVLCLVIVAIVTAILLAWPLIAYLAAEHFG